MADSTAIDGVLGAANAEVRLSVAGFGGVAIQVQGTFSGTITFEASVQGQDFTAFRVTPPNSSTPATTTTTTGVWVGSVVGYLVIRARMSSYSSGQATVLLRADVPSPGGASGGGGSGSDVNLIEVGGSTITLGETTMAASLPVVIASDQTAVDVNIVSGGGSGGTSSDFGDPFPAAGTAIGVADPDGTMQPLSAETLDYDTGAGTAAQTIIGIALPASGGPVAGGTATNPIQVAANSGTSAIYNGNTALTPKFAIIAESSSGANEVVALVSAKKIRVLNYTLIANGAVNAKWQSASTDISGSLYLVANMGASPAFAPTGHFETASGEALNLNLSSAVAVGGHLSYVEV